VAVSHRGALGALFLVLAGLFAGVAFTAFASDFDVVVWGIGAVAVGIALWLVGMALRALRQRPR
jgi:hypothetical protein